jgi:hypothetical protein
VYDPKFAGVDKGLAGRGGVRTNNIDFSPSINISAAFEDLAGQIQEALEKDMEMLLDGIRRIEDIQAERIGKNGRSMKTTYSSGPTIWATNVCHQ